MFARVALVTAYMLGVGCKCLDGKGYDGRDGSAEGDPSPKSGYGLVVEDIKLDQEQKRALLDLARAAVQSWVRHHTRIQPAEQLTSKYPHLKAHRACFVTLRQGGQLRGCIGSLEPHRSLLDDVINNAVAAAVHDSRFQPVQEKDLNGLEYSISVLDLPHRLEGVTASELPAYLKKHRPGVILEYHGRRSTFLPSVWEELSDPKDFLSRLCQKQGAPSDCWAKPDVQISTYGSIYFSEKDLP
ncbi:MAG: AMMECR1 domain-containing protein [Sorangium cellulosum]|nr:MAG: AMMECR1 domain-containing protein [Sorangium cellulosum]